MGGAARSREPPGPLEQGAPDTRSRGVSMITQPINTWGDAIFLSLSNALATFLNAIPLVIGALVILAIGWIISNVAARLIRELLARAGADRVFAEHGGDVYGSRSRQ